jgi:hypothetical protein
MARPTIRRRSLERVLGPVALYLSGLMLSALVAVTLGQLWLPVLLFAGGAATLLAWRQMRWPDDWSRYLSFGAVLLLMCAMNRVFYIADYVIAGPRFDDWPFFVEAPQVAVFKGEVITVTGTMITVLAWYLSGGLRVSPSVVLHRIEGNRWLLLVVYLMSLGGLAVSQMLAAVAAKLGQLLPTLLGLGIVGAFLLPLVFVRTRPGRLAATTLLSVPFIIVASGTGMKENMILAVLPLAVLAWTYLKHPIVRIGMLAVGLVTLALITSYVEVFRERVWLGKQDTTQTQVAQEFIDEIQVGEFGGTLTNGLAGFVARNNASFARGWAVSIADEQEFQPELVFSPLAYVFVPRVLWPEKPQIRQGWEYSGLVFGQEFLAWSDSSTAAGFYTSLYLGYGWCAFGIGAVLIGILLARMTLLAKRFGGSFAAGLYVFAMLPFSLRLDETWSVGALTAPIISLVYVLAIALLARLIAVIVPRRRPATTSAR